MSGDLIVPQSHVPAEPTTVGIVPEAPIMRKQTYASTMSYIGSARRLWAWASRWGSKSLPRAIVAWSAFVLAVLAMWTAVTAWYALTLLAWPLLFLLIPFRLMRRSQRKQEAYQRQQLATMQAMLVQQQAVIAQNAQAAAAIPAEDAGALEGSREKLELPAPTPQEEAQDVRNWT